MRGYLFFISLLYSTKSHAYRKHGSSSYSYNYFGPNSNSRSFLGGQFSVSSDWEEQWEAVKTLVPVAPSSKLVVEWPNNVKIEPGAFSNVEWMTTRPKLKWETERGALYTVMAVDGGIKRVLPQVFFHWGVTNIPGNFLNYGNEVMEYITPFSLEFDEDNNFITD